MFIFFLALFFLTELKNVLVKNYYDYCTGYISNEFYQNFEIESNKTESIITTENMWN